MSRLDNKRLVASYPPSIRMSAVYYLHGHGQEPELYYKPIIGITVWETRYEDLHYAEISYITIEGNTPLEEDDPPDNQIGIAVGDEEHEDSFWAEAVKDYLKRLAEKQAKKNANN